MPYQLRNLQAIGYDEHATLEKHLGQKYRAVLVSDDLLGGLALGYHQDPGDSDIIDRVKGKARPRMRNGKLVCKSKEFAKGAPDVDPEHDPIYLGFVASSWGRAVVGAAGLLAIWLWDRYGPADYEEFADLPRCEATPHDHQDDESYWNNGGSFGGRSPYVSELVRGAGGGGWEY